MRLAVDDWPLKDATNTNRSTWQRDLVRGSTTGSSLIVCLVGLFVCFVFLFFRIIHEDRPCHSLPTSM